MVSATNHWHLLPRTRPTFYQSSFKLGCILHNYTPSEGASCLSSRKVIFVGDSITRTLFFHVAHALDPVLPTAPQNNERKHADHTLVTAHGTQLTFFWDPFLNASRTYDFARGIGGNEKPALLVVGSGLWYLRYARASGGLPAWTTNMERILGLLDEVGHEPAELTVILPVEHVIPSKLGVERAASIHADDIDAMNSNLLRQLPPTTMPRPAIVVPQVFNKMLHPSQTEDGLHFSNDMVHAQASILLNLRCNDVLPKIFPFDKTCCNSYPRPKFMHLVVLATIILSAPCVWWFLGSRRFRRVLIRYVMAYITSSITKFNSKLEEFTNFSGNFGMLRHPPLQCRPDGIVVERTKAV